MSAFARDLKAAWPAIALAVLATACPASPKSEATSTSTSKSEAGKSAADPSPKSSPETGGSGPRFVQAPAGEVAALVQAERERAADDGGQLLVYVGASWCEPCQYFHDAVEAGRLDDAFPGLRLLEFDLDHDRDRLAAAGYGSRMIPLFVAPGPDGRGGPRRMEGSIKGPGAVDEIRPRLSALLTAAANDLP